MKTYIENYIKKCVTCQRSKASRIQKSPMIITTTAEEFNQEISLDFVGPLPRTKNENTIILTIQDNLTKFLQAYPMRDRRAETTAVYFLKYACTFGFPKAILTDQDPVFTSTMFREVNKLFKTKHKMISPYHPQTNGSLERSHVYLGNYLRAYVNDSMDDWDEMLYLTTFSYNTHINRSTKETPYKLVYGITPNIPSSLTKETTGKNYNELSQNIQEKLEKIRNAARNTLIQSKNVNKGYYDKKASQIVRQFKVGDYVFIKEGQAGPGKLAKKFKGPFRVIKSYPNSHTATIRMKKQEKTYHYNNLKLFVSDENPINISYIKPTSCDR